MSAGHGLRTKDFRLPAIVPIVLYNGDDNWTAVRTYKEYTEDYEKFGDSIIDFRYLLFDLKRMDDAEILSTKKFLDIAFSLDKMCSSKMSLEEYIRILSEHLKKLSPELIPEDKPKVAPWLVNRLGGLTESEKEHFMDMINQSLEKGEDRMDHAIDIMLDRVEARGAETRAIAVAKKLLAKNMSVDEVVEVSGLDLNTVLKIQSGEFGDY